MVESDASMWQHWRSRLRRLSVVLILGVLVVVLLQNWAEVEFHLFLTTVKMPGAVMLFAFAGAGFLVGALWGWWRR
jgi:uncharacterized integral membrane protein